MVDVVDGAAAERRKQRTIFFFSFLFLLLSFHHAAVGSIDFCSLLKFIRISPLSPSLKHTQNVCSLLLVFIVSPSERSLYIYSYMDGGLWLRNT